ncbi:hypothetical protein SKAU_G00295140 [Synaphobranchus kaupii]|uniref:Uncharacterized protein n=1 Tax=Synaphobranchus kaupii TaxID=118154 RepID=A0A9Q1EUI0_SYNKA|nr:hypothetical protein SKAU_G00295140 [Synaphobranchus kaupii]
MSTCVTLPLQTQVASILEVLAKSAIADISKVIDEGTAVLRLEISQSKKENETLKWRLLQMEKELQADQRSGKIRALAGDRIRSVRDEIREAKSHSYEEERSLSIDSVFGKEWSIDLWKDGELTATKEEEAPLQPVINEEATLTVEDRQDLFPIKVELFEENLEDHDPKISGGLEPERDSTERQYGEESDPQPASTEVTEEPYTQPAAAGGRLEQHTLPVTMEGTAEPHTLPAPPESTAGSEDARRYFLREISKVIDEGTAVLRLEISQSKKENETLKWRLLQMEKELQADRRGGKIRVLAGDRIRSVNAQVGDEIRGASSNSYEEDQSLSIDGEFGKWGIDLWKDGELTATKEEEAPLLPVINEEATQTVEDRQDLFPIKVELFEENMEDSDPHGGLKITGGLEPERDSTEHQHGEVFDQPASPDVTEEPYTWPAAAGGRLEEDTLPVTMEGTAEPHTLPAPPESTAGSEDARQYFLREISKVIDEGTAVLRLEISQSKKENETLKWRLLQMEKELQAERRGGKIRAVAGDRIRSVNAQVGDEIRGASSNSYEEERSLSIGSVFGKEWSIDLWKDGECTATKEEEAPLPPVINEEATQTVEDRQDLFPIKMELFEENMEDSDPHGGLKITGGLEPESDSTEHQHSEVFDQPASPDVTEEPYTQPAAAGGRLEEDTLPVASILEVLAKSAIAEIGQVIDEGTAVLRLEISQSKRENETLKWRLLQMEKELQAERRGGKIRALARDRIRSVNAQVGEEIRGASSNSYEEERSLSIDSVFGKEWSIDLWKDGEFTAKKEEEAPLQPVINEEATQTVEDKQDLFPIKMELFEENLEDHDPKISGGLEPERDSTEHQYGEESDPQPASAEVTEEPYTRPTAAGGRLEQHTLPVTMEGTAEPHTLPAPPESTAGSEDAHRRAIVIHMSASTGEKPHKCSECGGSFYKRLPSSAPTIKPPDPK